MAEPRKPFRKPSGSRPVVTRVRAGTKYSPSFCDDLVDMAGEGYSTLGFCGAVGICERTYYNWQDSYAEFREAHEIAAAIRVYGAETRFLNAGDSLNLNRSQAMLRAYGGKTWNLKEQDGGPWSRDFDWSKLSDSALEEMRLALGRGAAEVLPR